MARTRIIIADNSLFMRIMLKNVLETFGFEVVATAKDAREMVDKFAETKPDIALIDLALEGMGRVDLIHTITEHYPSAAVVLMIPERLDELDVIVDAVRAGVKGYIREPISPDELEALLGETLRKISKGCNLQPSPARSN